MEETKTELQLIKLSEIQSQEVSWLWFPFIPYGKLTIVQGDPGDGKTTFVLNIAAKLSKGEGIDSEMKLTEPLNVIYQSAEDGLADTVKPRLEQAGADCGKISVIDEKIKSLSMIDERLEQAIIKTGAKLLILDPIQAYLGGGMDMNRANEARDMTKKLAALAEKYQCAVVLEADWDNRLGHNEQCEQSSHQRQGIRRHTGEWVRLISASNEPSAGACTRIWRIPREPRTCPRLCSCKKRSVGRQSRGGRKYKGCGSD